MVVDTVFASVAHVSELIMFVVTSLVQSAVVEPVVVDDTVFVSVAQGSVTRLLVSSELPSSRRGEESVELVSVGVEMCRSESSSCRSESSVSVGVEIVSVGVELVSVGVDDVSVGVELVSVGVDDVSVGVELVSVGVDDVSVGVELVSVGVELVSVGVEIVSVGVDDVSVGVSRAVDVADVSVTTVVSSAGTKALAGAVIRNPLSTMLNVAMTETSAYERARCVPARPVRETRMRPLLDMCSPC